MDSISDVRKIIQDLYDEFVTEKSKLNDLCNSDSVKIDELEHKIRNCRKSEDVDFKVFSPRADANVDSKKIAELELEKDKLETELRTINKQLKYYSDKVNKLEEALSLIDGNDFTESFPSSDFIESVPDKVEEVQVDPFDELFPLRRKSQSEDEVSKNVSVETDEKILDEDNDSLESDQAVDILSTSSSDISADDTNKIDSLNQIVHKTEFVERILFNDSVRAKLEIKEIIRLLKDFIHNYF